MEFIRILFRRVHELKYKQTRDKKNLKIKYIFSKFCVYFEEENGRTITSSAGMNTSF